MSTLIFQIHIKQWDKSQRSPQQQAEREAMGSRFIIQGEPEFYILNKPCIIDLHHQTKSRPLKKAMLVDGSVKLERFIISEQDGHTVLKYQPENQPSHILGNLNDGWIQAKYQWRYAVEQGDKIFWQYEELTLNAACTSEHDAHYFLNNEPVQKYCAPEES